MTDPKLQKEQESEQFPKKEKNIQVSTIVTKNFYISLLHVLSMLALVIAILGFIIGFGVFKQSFLMHQQSQILDNKLQLLSKQQKSFQLSLDSNFSEDKKFQTQIDLLKNALQSLQQQKQYGQEEWLLLKARYYLELAVIQAHWETDAKLTVSLLQEADALLATSHNPRLLSVRQNINKNIIDIKTAPSLDLVALLSKLDALDNAINDLKVSQSIKINSPSSNTKNGSWQAYWQNSLNRLEKMIIIRHYDNDIQPVFSTQKIALLQENLRTQLQQAQWALMYKNNELFKSILAKCIKTIQSSFDTQQPNTSKFIQELHTLQNLPLISSPALHLNNSLQELNKLINAKPLEQSND